MESHTTVDLLKNKMKKIFTVFCISLVNISFSQEVDSTQYNIGYTVGENLPVALLMLVGLFFIYRGFKRRGETPEKTDYLDDGTIKKD